MEAVIETDKWDYTPPEVEWLPVYEDDIVVDHRAEPPFGKDWPEIQTLRHQAALVESRTGLKVRVALNDIRADEDGIPPLYDVLADHAIGGPAPYEVVWAWMSGFEVGINEYLRKKNERGLKSL
jgi:hypothetical protein